MFTDYLLKELVILLCSVEKYINKYINMLIVFMLHNSSKVIVDKFCGSCKMLIDTYCESLKSVFIYVWDL